MEHKERHEIAPADLAPQGVHRAALARTLRLGFLGAPATARNRLRDRSGELLGHPPTIGFVIDGRADPDPARPCVRCWLSMDASATKRRAFEIAVTAILIAAGGGLTLALTSGTGSSSTAAAPTGPAEMTDSVTIADFEYDPPAIQVSAGTEVSITNSDAAAHTITADDESFDSGTIDGDAEGSVTFGEPGTYEFFCRFHVFMKGTVEVE